LFLLIYNNCHDVINNVLKLKKIVLDLINFLSWAPSSGPASRAQTNLTIALRYIRAAIGNLTEYDDIPLEWYELNDDDFTKEIVAYLKKTN